MSPNIKTISAIIIPLVLIVFLSFHFLNPNGNEDNNLAVIDITQNENIVIPAFTDENVGESVIIKSDQENYTGDSGIESYFSVQNISKNDENFDIQFYFPKDIDVGVVKVERKIASGWISVGDLSTAVSRPKEFLNKKIIPEKFGAEGMFTSFISSGETEHFRAKIVFEENAQGEFWIEAIGDRGGYGLLDPTFSHVSIRGGGNAGGGGAPQAPTFIQEAETSWTTDADVTASVATGSFTTQTGDILVAYAVTSNYDNTLTLSISNSGTVQSWTQRQVVAVANYTWVSVWTATASVDQSMIVTVTRNSDPGTAILYGVNVLTFRGSDGVGASAKTNVASGAPTLDLTTTQANSAIVLVDGDWNAVDGASRTWRTNAGSLTEQTYFRDATQYVVYGGYHADVGAIGTYAVGLSAPGAQKYSIVAVEVKGTTGSVSPQPVKIRGGGTGSGVKFR